MRLDNRLVYCALVAPIVMVAGLGLLPRGAMAQTDDCDGWVALHDMLPRRYPVMVQTADGPLLWGGMACRLSQQTWEYQVRTSTCETWRFDGSTWRFVTVDGPSPRYRPAAAFDSHRDRVVLFGGVGFTSSGAAQYFRETWEFWQGRWKLRTPHNSPPVSLSLSSLVYDPSRQLTYTYRGSSDPAIGSSLWAYDGEDWTQTVFAQPNPGPQSDHHLIFDPRDASITLIPVTATNPSWKWNGETWEQLAPTGVSVSSAIFDPARQSIVLVSDSGTFYTFSGSASADAISEFVPPAIGTNLYPTVLPMPSGDWLTVVGPVNTPLQSEPAPASFIVSQADGWSLTESRTLPMATAYVGFDYFPPTKEFVLFGGRLRHGAGNPGGTWLLRGEHWRRFQGPQPATPYASYLLYMPTLERLALTHSQTSTPQRWLWNGSEWLDEPAPPQRPIAGVGLTPPVFDPISGLGLLRFGTTVTTLDGTRISQRSSGFVAEGSASAFDPVRGAVLLAGASNVSARGTYELRASNEGSNFVVQTLIPQAQTGSTRPRMAFDPDREGVVLFGGLTGLPNQSWWNRQTFFLASTATNWQAMEWQTNGPLPREHAGMAYDPVARRIIMYGGLQLDATYPLRETWKLARGPAAVALEPIDTYVVPGETAEAFIIASGGGVIHYQWFKDGVALANSGRITGADSDTLQIQDFTSDDNGEYHVTVHNPCGDDQSITVQLRAIPACPGDFNDSGGVDATDLAEFFDAYERGLMLADVDLSGGIDANDMALFIESFQAGGC